MTKVVQATQVNNLHGYDLGVCYQYNVGGAGSFNIADCYYEDSCLCEFSTGEFCGDGNTIYLDTSSQHDGGYAECGNTATTIWEPNYITCSLVTL